MGPKKKGKGGNGSPTQGEEAKAGEKISEVDKEWFGIQIKSLEEKLDRRNEKLRCNVKVFFVTILLESQINFYILGGLRRETMSLRPSLSSSERTRPTLWPSSREHSSRELTQST